MNQEHRIRLQDAENHFGRRRYIQKLIDNQPKPKRAPAWIQADGYRVFLSNMTDLHLINSIKMLDRQVVKLQQERAARHRHMSWDDPVYDDDIDSALDKIKILKKPLEKELGKRKKEL